MVTNSTAAERPREGDTVMICKHVWQASSCNVAVPPPPAHKIQWSVADAPQVFTRDDGSKTPPVRFAAVCKIMCARVPRFKEVDYIETVWRNGRFQVVDYL